MSSSALSLPATPQRRVFSPCRAFFALLLVCVGATFVGCAEFVHFVSVSVAWGETVEASERWATAGANAQTFEGGYRAYVNFKNELLAIDVSDCPPDFQEAFQRLIDAVDYAAQTIANLSGNNGFESALEGFATTLLDNPDARIHDALNELEQLAKKYVE